MEFLRTSTNGLLVHGGPWARGVGATMDCISGLNRGYAVLDVNFRGSTGFGKELLISGDGHGQAVCTMICWIALNGLLTEDPKADKIH